MKPEVVRMFWMFVNFALKVGVITGTSILFFAVIGVRVCDDLEDAEFVHACELAHAQPLISRRKKVVRNVRRENHAGLL